MAEITQVKNPLSKSGFAGSGTLSTPEITEIQFSPGELTKEESEHAKAVAFVSFHRLVWYVQEMQKSNCSYRDAVVKVNKRKP